MIRRVFVWVLEWWGLRLRSFVRACDTYFARDSGFSRSHKIVLENKGMSMMGMLWQAEVRGWREEDDGSGREGIMAVAGTRERRRGGDVKGRWWWGGREGANKVRRAHGTYVDCVNNDGMMAGRMVPDSVREGGWCWWKAGMPADTGWYLLSVTYHKDKVTLSISRELIFSL